MEQYMYFHIALSVMLLKVVLIVFKSVNESHPALNCFTDELL